MRPRFLKQETRYSCAPACLRMVLTTFGIDQTEAELRALTDCTPLGTQAFQVVGTARKFGLTSSRKCILASVDELGELVSEGMSPIVYVDLWPLQGGQSGQHHSLVVVAVGSRRVTVLNPLAGEEEISREDFDAAWAQMRRLAILISP
ncbi:MAG TPA: cysteine peptidase family C39 domain-containing protein [Blastocatellia bacterium]|nr:cysteine peptidase family C39 domain-containing protein [Blastocatellia bacterium]